VNVTARRQFGATIVACLVGAGLVLLALRQHWAHADYTAPRPLPSGQVSVSGASLLPAASALALAAVACLAAIIATRGVARRAAGVLMTLFGVWVIVVVSAPVHAASVVAAAAGAGSTSPEFSGGNSAISGGGTSGSGGTPLIGSVTRVVLDSLPWRTAAVIGAALVIAAGLLAAWRGQRWAVMSARFGRTGTRPAAPAPGVPAPLTPDSTTPDPTGPGSARLDSTGADSAGPDSTGPDSTGLDSTGPETAATPRDATHADRDDAVFWEALDRGVDLTESAAEPSGRGSES